MPRLYFCVWACHYVHRKISERSRRQQRGRNLSVPFRDTGWRAAHSAHCGHWVFKNAEDWLNGFFTSREENLTVENIYLKSLRSISTHPKTMVISLKTKPNPSRKNRQGTWQDRWRRHKIVDTTHYTLCWFLLWLFKYFINSRHTLFFFFCILYQRLEKVRVWAKPGTPSKTRF